MNKIEQIYAHFTKSLKATTDSRKVEDGSVFFALKGANFDGNDFVEKVVAENKTAIAVSDRADIKETDRIIKVDDVLTALQQVATMHRKTLKTTIIGITGTNGKTTTKELTSATLSKKFRTVFTQGNLNNHIGVPLTLLTLRPDTEIAVVEMGASHPKDIELLCNIATPDYGIITNIGKAHLEGFGSLEGVIKTKNEMYEHLRANSKTAFVNTSNPLLNELSADLKRVSYGSDNAQCVVKFVSANPLLAVEHEGMTIQTNLVGGYNTENVAAAICVGKHFGISKEQIKEALEAYTPSNNRSQVMNTKRNRIIMDAYNANPVSMRAAITNFKNICKDKSMLIIGKMGEIGETSEQEHQEIIKLIESLHFDKVLLVGEEMVKAAQGHGYPTFNDINELKQYLTENPVSGYDILVKGSHSVQLEKTAEFL